MDIDPSILALRRNPASQRRAQSDLEQAKADWLTENTDVLLDDLAKYGAGQALQDCSSLRETLESYEHAKQLICSWFSGLSQALEQNPLGQIPFRHQYRKGVGVFQLAVNGNATLSLMLYEEQNHGPAQSICFAGGDCTEIVIAGLGAGRLIEIASESDSAALLRSRDLHFSAGTTMAYSGPSSAKIVDQVCGMMAVLRLSRPPAIPVESREYRISDGALLHRASGDRNESRQQMIIALLGAMRRNDAVPAIEAKCTGGSASLRWQAVRQLLAMDTARGFAVLGNLANAPEGELASAATALRAQLTAKYPQLFCLETA
ncbi:MAG: hypothetical protein WAT93_08205 [Pontixanthobacter sp.]